MKLWDQVIEPIEGRLVNIIWKVRDTDKHFKKILKSYKKLKVILLRQLQKSGLDYSKTEWQARLEIQSQNVKDL